MTKIYTKSKWTALTEKPRNAVAVQTEPWFHGGGGGLYCCRASTAAADVGPDICCSSRIGLRINKQLAACRALVSIYLLHWGDESCTTALRWTAHQHTHDAVTFFSHYLPLRRSDRKSPFCSLWILLLLCPSLNFQILWRRSVHSKSVFSHLITWHYLMTAWSSNTSNSKMTRRCRNATLEFLVQVEITQTRHFKMCTGTRW